MSTAEHAAVLERGRQGISARSVAAAVALGAVPALGFVLAAGGAHQRLLFFLPSTRAGYHDWLAGPFASLDGNGLDPTGACALLLAMFVAWLVALAWAGELARRWTIAAIVAAHVIFLLGPPLFSGDVFGYIAYGRLAANGLNPYTEPPTSLGIDNVRPFELWDTLTTPYGPLFSLALLPLGALGVPGALWLLKLTSAACSLAVVAMVWRVAELRGRDPLLAAVLVGLNPLLLAYGVAGAHNDFPMLIVVMGGIWLALLERDRAAGALLACAALMKVSLGAALPFFLAARRRAPREALLGAAFALALVIAATIPVFGLHAVDFVDIIRKQQEYVARESVPRQVALLLGFDGEAALPAGIRFGFLALFAGAIAWLLRETWRGAMDWVDATGWATLAVLVSTAWLVPWYVVWLLPIAAVSRDRRLLGAAIAVTTYVMWTRIDPYLL